MTTTSKKPKDKNAPWYEEPVKKWFAVISGFAVVCGIGYTFGVFQKSLEFKIEEFELKQECSEKLQAQIESCKNEKQAYENKRVDNLEIIVKDLQKNNGRTTK